MVMSGRSNGSLVGSTWVDRAAVSLLMISVVAKTSSFCSAGTSLPVSGNDGDQAAADVDQGADVAGLDFVRQDGAGPFVDERLRLRPTARAGAKRPLGRCDRQQLAESLELISESGMKPCSAARGSWRR